MDIEEWLINVLESRDAREHHAKTVDNGWETVSGTKMLAECGFFIPRPKYPWLFDDSLIGEDRLFTDNAKLLLANTQEFLRQRFEIAINGKEPRVLQWIPQHKPLQGFLTPPGMRQAVFVSKHYGTSNDSIVHVVGFNATNVVPLKHKSVRIDWPPTLPEELKTWATLCLSYLEDANLDKWWHVRVRSVSGIGFNVPATPESCRELLKMRDGPVTATGRRKSLIHWVKSHSRARAGKPAQHIDRFLRGVETVQIDREIYAEIDPRVLSTLGECHA